MTRAARSKSKRNPASWRAIARRFAGVCPRAARDTSGAAAVEFALLVWPFLALAFGILQLALIFLMGQAVQTVAVQSGRMYMTGQVEGASQAAFKTAICAKLPPVFNCNNVMVDLQVSTDGTASGIPTAPLTPTYSCTGSPKVCTLNNSGWQYTESTPDQYAILRVMYDFPVLGGVFAFANQPNGSVLLVGTTVFQVEPYPTS